MCYWGANVKGVLLKSDGVIFINRRGAMDVTCRCDAAWSDFPAQTIRVSRLRRWCSGADLVNLLW